MNEIPHGVAPTPADNLHAELRSLIASSRQRLAGAVNAELTRLYWSVGKRLHTEVLGGADRAKYGDQLVKRVGDQLAQEFGRGFEAKNLRCMVQFALAFPDVEKVASLMRHLSWTHFLQLLPSKLTRRAGFMRSKVWNRAGACASCAGRLNAKPSSAPNSPRCKPKPPFKPIHAFELSLSKPWAPAPPKSSKTRTF